MHKFKQAFYTPKSCILAQSHAHLTYTYCGKGQSHCENAGGVGQDHVNPDFADSALLLPLNLYGEKRRPFRWANKTCRALL